MEGLWKDIPNQFLANLDDFSIEDPLDRDDPASTFIVYRGTDLRQNPPRTVAIREARASTDSDYRTFHDELCGLIKHAAAGELSHDGILNLIAIIPPRNPDWGAPMIVVPWMEHQNLSQVLKCERSGEVPVGWNPTKKSIVVFGMAVAMAHLHSKNIVHGELSPQKIFLNEHFEPVIGGMGFFKFTDNLMMNRVWDKDRFFGAPESWDLNPRPTSECDVYSYGMTLLHMFSDSRELDGVYPRTKWHLMMSFVKGARPSRVPEIPGIFWELITACWAREPELRPSFAEIVQILCEHEDDWLFPGTDLTVFHEYKQRILQGGGLGEAEQASTSTS